MFSPQDRKFTRALALICPAARSDSLTLKPLCCTASRQAWLICSRVPGNRMLYR